MKLLLYFFLLIVPAVAQESELAVARSSYQSGEFKTAIAHWQRALKTDPQNAECNYWIGRSYETLADMATPFGRKYRTLARTYLTRATEQAPNRAEYRRELFDFLLDSSSLRSAQGVLASMESDPEYEFLLSRFRKRESITRRSISGFANFSNSLRHGDDGPVDFCIAE